MKKLKSALIFIVVITGVVFTFFQFKWKTFDVKTKIEIEIQTTEEHIEKVAKLWFDKYTAQFKEIFTPLSYKIKDACINYMKILDEDKGYIQIDYAYLPFSDNMDFILNHDGLIYEKDGWYQQQVVLMFNKTENGYKVTKAMRPVEYQIQNDPSISTDNIQPPTYAITKENDYYISNNTLFVTYDFGETFVEVPIPYDEVTYDPNSSFTSFIPTGSYIIEKDYTAFLYVEDEHLGLIYSLDQGKTWEDKLILSDYDYYLRTRFLSKTDSYIYVLCSTDKAMSSESHMLLRSTDGQNFEKVDYEDPELRAMTYAYFSEDDIGYVAYKNNDVENLSFYRTSDGGKTFTPITFELVEIPFMDEMMTPYIQVDRIYKENNQIHIIVGQGDNGDYGYNSAHYVSNDGIHFEFIEEVDDRSILAG